MSELEFKQFFKWIVRLAIWIAAVYVYFFSIFRAECVYILNDPITFLNNQQRLIDYGFMLAIIIIAMLSIIFSIKDIICWRLIYIQAKREIEKRYPDSSRRSI